jgi:hypothetical protein
MKRRLPCAIKSSNSKAISRIHDEIVQYDGHGRRMAAR